MPGVDDSLLAEISDIEGIMLIRFIDISNDYGASSFHETSAVNRNRYIGDSDGMAGLIVCQPSL